MSIGTGLAQWCQDHQATPLPTPQTADEVYPWPDPKISVLPIEIGNAAGHKVRTVVGWDGVANQILAPGPGVLVEPVPTTPITMYDSTNAVDIPWNVLCVAGYVDGRYSAWSGIPTGPTGDWARFPNAKLCSITALGASLATLVDSEAGDLPADAAANCVGNGTCYGVYTQLDADQSNQFGVAPMKAAFARINQPLKVLIAHWTSIPHICDATCAAQAGDPHLFDGLTIIGTQYANPATSGGHYDLSLITQEFYDTLG